MPVRSPFRCRHYISGLTHVIDLSRLSDTTLQCDYFTFTYIIIRATLSEGFIFLVYQRQSQESKSSQPRSRSRFHYCPRATLEHRYRLMTFSVILTHNRPKHFVGLCSNFKFGCFSFQILPPKQPVFAFLPLRSYGFRFIVQGQFVIFFLILIHH